MKLHQFYSPTESQRIKRKSTGDSFYCQASSSRTKRTPEVNPENKEVNEAGKSVCTPVCTNSQEKDDSTSIDVLLSALLDLPAEKRAKLIKLLNMLDQDHEGDP